MSQHHWSPNRSKSQTSCDALSRLRIFKLAPESLDVHQASCCSVQRQKKMELRGFNMFVSAYGSEKVWRRLEKVGGGRRFRRLEKVGFGELQATILEGFSGQGSSAVQARQRSRLVSGQGSSAVKARQRTMVCTYIRVRHRRRRRTSEFVSRLAFPSFPSVFIHAPLSISIRSRLNFGSLTTLASQLWLLAPSTRGVAITWLRSLWASFGLRASET